MMAISTFLLGISTTFLALVARQVFVCDPTFNILYAIGSRCLFSLNNNTATTKTIVGEITDETNRADAFAFLGVPVSIGGSLG